MGGEERELLGPVDLAPERFNKGELLATREGLAKGIPRASLRTQNWGVEGQETSWQRQEDMCLPLVCGGLPLEGCLCPSHAYEATHHQTANSPLTQSQGGSYPQLHLSPDAGDCVLLGGDCCVGSARFTLSAVAAVSSTCSFP